MSLVGYCQDSWLLLCVRLGNPWKVLSRGVIFCFEIERTVLGTLLKPSCRSQGWKQGDSDLDNGVVFKLDMQPLRLPQNFIGT